MKKINLKMNAIYYCLFFCIVSMAYMAFEVWLENGSSDTYTYITTHIPNAAVRTFIWILITGIAFFFLYSKVCEYYDMEISKRDVMLEDSSKLIWQKYSDLYRFKHNDIIKNILKNLVDTEDYLVGGQLYSYVWKQEKNFMILKVNHVCSYISEGESQNSIEQCYFRISKKLYREFCEALAAIYLRDYEVPLAFVEKYTEKLRLKPIESISEVDAMQFAVTSVIAQRMHKIYNNIDETTVIDLLSNNDKLMKLESICRIGFLSAILADEYYISYNNRSTTKMKRTYLTDTLTISQQPHIILLTTKPFEDLRFEAAYQYKYFIDEFIKLLKERDETVRYTTRYDELYYDVNLENDDYLEEIAPAIDEDGGVKSNE